MFLGFGGSRILVGCGGFEKLLRNNRNIFIIWRGDIFLTSRKKPRFLAGNKEKPPNVKIGKELLRFLT